MSNQIEPAFTCGHSSKIKAKHNGEPVCVECNTPGARAEAGETVEEYRFWYGRDAYSDAHPSITELLANTPDIWHAYEINRRTVHTIHTPWTVVSEVPR